MVLTAVLDNLRHSSSLSGTASDKMSVFMTLTRLQIKRRLYRRSNGHANGQANGHAALAKDWFSRYSFSGYNYFTLEYLFKEVFISNDYYFEAATNAPIIVDCGANIGMSILYFKKLYPEARITAFEANPHAFAMLKQNVESNHLEDVHLHNVALYDAETEISFFIGEDVGTLLGSIKPERGGGNELKVRAARLSTYLADMDQVDLIKMDVEGAEVKIFADLLASGTITKAREYIVEYHHNMDDNKSNLAGFLQLFESSGYSYNIKATYQRVDSFQDILIHFFKKG